ncbi:hypothetical protein A1351_04165 [Methylosinus sp. R-45379]|nr:hypothetical protein A1351_04165 [Methylosinus sp. R-45379]
MGPSEGAAGSPWVGAGQSGNAAETNHPRPFSPLVAAPRPLAKRRRRGRRAASPASRWSAIQSDRIALSILAGERILIDRTIPFDR